MEFEAIYREYWSKGFRLCMGYVNDYGLAQDMAQETFVAVWQKLSSFRNEAAVGTWIFRIATNRCLRQLERQSRMVPVTLSTDLHEEERKGIGLRFCLLFFFRRWTASSFHSNWKMSGRQRLPESLVCLKVMSGRGFIESKHC